VKIAAAQHEARTRTARSRMAATVGLTVSAAVVAAVGTPVLAHTDSAAAATPTSVTTAGPNLIKDPELVHGTAAWSVAAGGKLATVAGYNGHRAISVLNTTSAAKTLRINDRLNTVVRTQAGAVYRASAWIKTWSRIAGGTRQIEYAGTTYKGGKFTSARFSSNAWKKVSVDYRAASSGASIDYNVLAWALPARTHLLMSRPSLVRLTTSAPAPTPSSTPTGYHLVFHDDFNSVDTSKWRVRNNDWAGNEESIVTSRAKNVFTSNGALTLRAVHEKYTVYGTTRQYTSGYLDTIGKESWKYGRMEMRAKLPAAQGMWPAFWLREGSGLGEIDIMEAIGGMTRTTVQTVHQSTNGDQAKAGHENVFASGTTSAWHTYAVDREPGFVKWYVDGRLVFSKTVSALSWLDSAFNQPMNIRLNLQVGGSMPNWYHKPVIGAPLGKSDFVIDYVRVFQKG
jgi:beta-glucanase (GH16 family)